MDRALVSGTRGGGSIPPRGTTPSRRSSPSSQSCFAPDRWREPIARVHRALSAALAEQRERHPEIPHSEAVCRVVDDVLRVVLTTLGFDAEVDSFRRALDFSATASTENTVKPFSELRTLPITGLSSVGFAEVNAPTTTWTSSSRAVRSS